MIDKLKTLWNEGALTVSYMLPFLGKILDMTARSVIAFKFWNSSDIYVGLSAIILGATVVAQVITWAYEEAKKEAQSE